MTLRRLDHAERSAAGLGEKFEAVLSRRASRRGVIGAGLVLTTAAAGGGLLGCAGGSAPERRSPLGFVPIRPSRSEEPMVPRGYRLDVLLRWGDPLLEGAPPFDPERLTPAAQAMQFGYDCDYVAYLPHADREGGLLVVNHEFTDPRLMFSRYAIASPSREQVDVLVAAHGLSVVDLQRDGNGRWSVVAGSRFHRRITGETPVAVSGPAAGHELLRTGEDPEGRLVRGTLNNCAGGKTPWGTVLTAEENFHLYFGHGRALRAADPRAVSHVRYGVPEGPSVLRWEEHHPRFDVRREPNEPFRFGWVVEVDPFDPSSTPVKRTALGRFRHEAATVTLSREGHAVVYTADDAPFEYIYKFVSAGRSEAGRTDLLDEGTLHVARFDEDGSGRWIPLRAGEGQLTVENGFHGPGDVAVHARIAADLSGATKMDRPEDIEVSPTTGHVFVALTRNVERGERGAAPADAANPRAANRFGHVLEIAEDGGDHAGESFRWEILLLCGDPEDPGTYFAGCPKSSVSPISCPDNLTFDSAGNLWIATDGQGDTLGVNDGLHAVAVEGPDRGNVAAFFGAVPGAEVCGPEFTPDGRSLFLAVQHPGSGGTWEAPRSRWPDGEGPPRPSVVVVSREDGGVIGG